MNHAHVKQIVFDARRQVHQKMRAETHAVSMARALLLVILLGTFPKVAAADGSTHLRSLIEA